MSNTINAMLRFALSILVVACIANFATTSIAQDTIEFLSGAKADGRVTSIDKQNQRVTFDAKIGGRTLTRTYAYSTIHAITYQGKRYVLNEKNAAPASNAGGATTGATPKSVEDAIRAAGASPPAWFDATPLNYPKSLDLSWPKKPAGKWNNQKNVGQFNWDVINPNPGRWREGVKLMHHLLALHKDDPEKRTRIMTTLAGMHFNFFQDYARAAFWWKQAGVDARHNAAMSLAECYWRLGDAKTATSFLADPDKPKATNSLRVGMIKLWGDMGQTEKAVKVAEWYVRSGGEQQMAYLLAADACRIAGRYETAATYYQKVLDAPRDPKNKRVDRTIERARASLTAIKLFELSDVSKVADGTYRANSKGYEGPVEVEVKVASSKIESVKVVSHREKQFYSAIDDVPAQIIQKQGVKGVDATSRATITGEAIINATAKALASGVK